MKNRIAPALALAASAALSWAPLAASADDAESARLCMESFSAQNFPDRAVTFQMTDERSMPMPLIASSGTRSVELVARDGSGRLLARATCQVRDVGGRGSVVIGPIE